MDRKSTIRERRRRKRRQMMIRKCIRIGVYLAAIILVAVFVVRGIIRPIMNRGSSEDAMVGELIGETETVTTTAESGTAETTSETGTNSQEDAAGEVTTTTAAVQSTASSGSTIAKRVPIRGASDSEKIGVLTPGWHSTSSGTWYQNADGTYYANGFHEIDGKQYCFDSSGYLQTGWVESGANEYYFDENGVYDSTKKRPMLCLTFDDGPGDYTSELLDCLEENGAKATFFMLGERVQFYPDEVKRMVEIGCEIGNHSYDHSNLVNLELSNAVWQFTATDQELIEVCGQASTVCRAPYGSGNKDIYTSVGKPFAMWSLDTLDWSNLDADMDYNIVMNGDLTDGSIILMHDIHEQSVVAAKRLIPDLVAAGYRLVTFSEMAEAKNVELQGALYTDFWESSLKNGIVPGYQGEKNPADQ